jgi:hypothetical protein
MEACAKLVKERTRNVMKQKKMDQKTVEVIREE